MPFLDAMPFLDLRENTWMAIHESSSHHCQPNPLLDPAWHIEADKRLVEATADIIRRIREARK